MPLVNEKLLEEMMGKAADRFAARVEESTKRWRGEFCIISDEGD